MKFITYKIVYEKDTIPKYPFTANTFMPADVKLHI